MQYSTIHVHCMCFACVKSDCHAANLINRTEPRKKPTRRRAVLSASDDRTARRQFQANGQPVSRTQASDAMTSRMPCCEMKCVQRRCFQCTCASLCVQISRERSYPLPIYWYHSKGNWLRYNLAAESFYILKLFSRLFVRYCRNCPKDDKFR